MLTQQLTPLPPTPTRPSRFGRKTKIGATAVVALVAVALATTRASGESGLSLRTAIAGTRSVTKSLDEVGTVEPISAASVAFPVAGDVASVTVKKGDSVSRGQVLATLDTTALARLVNNAQAVLTQSKLALAEAIAGNAAASDDSARDTPSASDALSPLRQAVLDAQQTVDERISDAQAEYESATAVCDAVTADTVASCQAALTTVMTAQQRTAEAQQRLSDASKAFDDAVAQSVSAADQDRTPTTASNTASAAELASLQKAIDAAEAALAVAHQNVAAATIVSPIDGTVESVAMVVGQNVAAGSSDAVIKVVGPNGYEVTAIVAVEKLANIKLGQRATVQPDGSKDSVDGEVVAIGAPRTANGATSYPVSIGVDDSEALRNGSVANVSIITGSANSGVVVPTSAVHTENGSSTVNVVEGADVSAVTVTVGVVGTTWTQIKSGLKAGQVVVLADLDAALPDSATNSSNSSGGNGGKATLVEIPGGVFLGPPGGGVRSGG